MPVKLNETGTLAPLDPIPLQEIQALRANYATAPYVLNTRSGWVSVYELMALISDNKANGVRIYFGRHPKNSSTYSSPYPEQNTVILVATLDSKNPANPTTFDSVDLLNAFEANGPVNSVSYTSGYQGMGGDMIPLCPPNCPNP
ncbi:hypothetical protein [Mucilaginibacter sp.]|uniref:hypothetical protein n=1 Tax=Mucilaginibacter sp. TaxID=1882438 RepID=UPI0032631AF0